MINHIILQFRFVQSVSCGNVYPNKKPPKAGVGGGSQDQVPGSKPSGVKTNRIIVLEFSTAFRLSSPPQGGELLFLIQLIVAYQDFFHPCPSLSGISLESTFAANIFNFPADTKTAWAINGNQGEKTPTREKETRSCISGGSINQNHLCQRAIWRYLSKCQWHMASDPRFCFQEFNLRLHPHQGKASSLQLFATAKPARVDK